MQIERLAYRRQLVGVERRRPPRAALGGPRADAGQGALGVAGMASGCWSGGAGVGRGQSQTRAQQTGQQGQE